MQRAWFVYAMITTVTWGVWGAFSDGPARHGFPETLTYVVWAFTMVLPAVLVLRGRRARIPRDARSLALGLAIGLFGAGGVIVLFPALSLGPSYLVFPIVSLSPLVTIAFSWALLGERTGRLGKAGIAVAIASLPLLNDWTPQGGGAEFGLWFLLSLAIVAAWGIQGYFIKLAHRTMDSGAIFFYMTLGGLLLVPVALARTDWGAQIEWGWYGPPLSALVQVLNAVGSLALVHALREGKAIVVMPLTNSASTLITAAIALAMTGDRPGPYKIAGIALAIASSALLAMEAD